MEDSCERKRDDANCARKFFFARKHTERGDTVWALAQHAGCNRINENRFGRGKVAREGYFASRRVFHGRFPFCVDFLLLFVW